MLAFAHTRFLRFAHSSNGIAYTSRVSLRGVRRLLVRKSFVYYVAANEAAQTSHAENGGRGDRSAGRPDTGRSRRRQDPAIDDQREDEEPAAEQLLSDHDAPA